MTQSTLAEDAEIIAPELLVRPVSAVSGLAVAGPTRHAVVWIADAAAGTVWRGEVRQTGPIVRAVGGGGMPLAVAIREGRVWVAQPGEVVQVREGETLCFVCESGSGKSVTSLTVMGLLQKGALTPASGNSDRVTSTAVNQDD